MRRFEILIKYLNTLLKDSLGDWIVDRINDGTEKHPKQFPFVSYSQTVHNFKNDVNAFLNNNRDLAVIDYREILEKNDIELNLNSVMNADVSNLSEHCIFAMILWIFRAERFCEGTILSFFESGSMQR